VSDRYILWYEEERIEGVSRSRIKEGLSEVLFALETLLLSVFFFFISSLFIYFYQIFYYYDYLMVILGLI
jgi:hypothetical protein